MLKNKQIHQAIEILPKSTALEMAKLTQISCRSFTDLYKAEALLLL